MKSVQVTQVRIGLNEALRLLQEAYDSLEPIPLNNRNNDYVNPNPMWARSLIERVMGGLEASADLLDESGKVMSGEVRK